MGGKGVSRELMELGKDLEELMEPCGDLPNQAQIRGRCLELN